MHGHRHGGCRYPEMNVRSAVVVFIHIHFDYAFMESVNTGGYDRTGESEGTFCKDDHEFFSVPLVRNVLGIEPDSNGAVIALDGDEFRIAVTGRGLEDGDEVGFVVDRAENGNHT